MSLCPWGSLAGKSKVGMGVWGGWMCVGGEYVWVEGGGTQKQTEEKRELLSNHLIPFN